MRTLSGLEVFIEKRLELVKGKAVGLVASPSGVDWQLSSTVNRLYAHPDVNLVALFGPEHGLRGEAQAGEHVSTYTDKVTGLPVYSLYGETRKPTPEMLQKLDVLIVDLQDGGVRFYTYLATTAYVMEAAAENGVAVIVLDRPAPINAVRVEGPKLDASYTSFVGPYPTPVRYGLSIGEIASLFNQSFGIGCDLTVVPMENWSREMWFDQTGLPFVPPSPNLPTLTAMTLYPGTCWIEGTNLSEGRGTTRPFEYIGAPWIDAEALADALNDLKLDGVRFRPVYFVPTFSKYQGEQCGGVHVYVTDRDRLRPIDMTLHLMALIKAMYPDHFGWREPWSAGGHYPIDLLTGGNTVRLHLDAQQPVADLIQSWQEDLERFNELRAEFLLYGC
jgi:uncharacterized protein YbbC (DUF1343 family)